MSYKTATIQNLADGETGYQLTSDPGKGTYVACRWECKRRKNQVLDCIWYARQVSTDGSAVTDAMGKPITAMRVHPHAPPDIVADGGIDAVKKQMLEVVLGEPDAVVDIDDDIRDAITAAAFVT